MISFECDYNKGAHPLILKKLIETNEEALSGYGNDKYTISAKEKIKKAIGDINSQVEFIAGGTQTNMIVISSMLKDYEGVIACDSGHINTHEAGAIEATGHKVITLKNHFGKLDYKDIDKYITDFYSDGSYYHMVYPGMVYISHPTEYGTLYTKEELTNIRKVCDKYNIPLFIDGARLGYAIMSDESDLSLQDIAKLSDVFYIGGTKVGALIGEAIVFTKNNMPKNFKTIIKRRGALLAKGRLIGIQFDTLFTDNLYFEISKNAIVQANKIKNIFLEKGYKLFVNSPTNQQFIVMNKKQIDKLKEKVGFEIWEKIDDTYYSVRFATSWATTDEEVEYLKSLL